MARSSVTDPLRNFKFRVNIQLPSVPGLAQIGFASMSGISVQNELIPYREGGWNTSPHKMVGQSDFAPVSFSRGIMPKEDSLWAWQKLIYVYQWGSGQLASTDNPYRCDISVDIFDHPITAGVSDNTPGPISRTIKLYSCWPGAWAMNDLNASDNSLLIQQMTVHHEGFDIIVP